MEGKKTPWSVIDRGAVPPTGSQDLNPAASQRLLKSIVAVTVADSIARPSGSKMKS